MNKHRIIEAARNLPEEVAALCPEFAGGAADNGLAADSGALSPRGNGGDKRSLFKGIVVPLVLIAAGLTATLVTVAALKHGKPGMTGRDGTMAGNTPDVSEVGTAAPAATPDTSRNRVYSPNYDSGNMRHVEEFITILKRDGYHWGGEIDKNFNTENMDCRNITPAGMYEENPDLELFYVHGGGACFLMYKNELYRADTFGGYHKQMCYWDYDGNGVKDLVSSATFGSGLSFVSVSLLDLSTMEGKAILLQNVTDGFKQSNPKGPKNSSIRLTGDDLYVGGKKISYSHGLFLMDGYWVINGNVDAAFDGDRMNVEFRSEGEQHLTISDAEFLTRLYGLLGYGVFSEPFELINVRAVSPSGNVIYEASINSAQIEAASTRISLLQAVEEVNAPDLAVQLGDICDVRVLKVTKEPGLNYSLLRSEKLFDTLVIKLECNDPEAIVPFMDTLSDAVLAYALKEYNIPCCILYYCLPDSSDYALYSAVNTDLGFAINAGEDQACP